MTSHHQSTARVPIQSMYEPVDIHSLQLVCGLGKQERYVPVQAMMMRFIRRPSEGSVVPLCTCLGHDLPSNRSADRIASSRLIALPAGEECERSARDISQTPSIRNLTCCKPRCFPIIKRPASCRQQLAMLLLGKV